MSNKECVASQDLCITISGLVTVAQQSINEGNRRISEIEKMPNVDGKDVFIKELRKNIDRDNNTILKAIEEADKCGCKETGIGVLFAY